MSLPTEAATVAGLGANFDVVGTKKRIADLNKERKGNATQFKKNFPAKDAELKRLQALMIIWKGNNTSVRPSKSSPSAPAGRAGAITSDG